MLKHFTFFKNTIMLYVMMGINYIFPLITTAFLSRILGTDTYGVLSFMIAFSGYFQMFLDFGFNYYSTSLIAQNKTSNNTLNKILTTTLLSKFSLVVISFFVFIVLACCIEILRENVLLAFLYYFSTALSVLIIDFFYRGLEKMEVITFRYLIMKSIFLILVILVVSSPEDVYLVPIFNACGTIISALITWLHAKNKLKVALIKVNKKLVYLYIKESSKYFFALFGTTLFGITNSFAMGVLGFSTSDIACWNIAYQLATAVQTIFSPIVTSLFPHIADTKDFKFVKKLIFVLEPFVIIGVVVGIFVSPWVIKIFSGDDYNNAVLVLQILLVYIVFSFPNLILVFPVLSNLGKIKFVDVAIWIAGITHVVGIVFLCFTGYISIYSLAILRVFTEILLFILCITKLLLIKKC